MDTQLKLTVGKQKSALIARYITNHYTAQKVPDDICKLVEQFYDEVISFNINREKLQKFLSGDKLFGEEFIVNNLRFRCALNPAREIEKFSLQFLLQPTISKVVAYFYMYNIQADTYWKGTIVFNRDSILEDEDKSATDQADDMWSLRELPLIDYKDEECLDLSIWPQILSIYYVADSGLTDYHRDIRMLSTVDYTWRVSKEELKEWIGCEILKAIPSENFPVREGYYNWVVSIIPNGGNEETAGMVFLFLDLTRFPHGIKYIEMDWEVTMSYNGVSCKGHHRFGYGVYWMTHMFDKSEIDNEVFKSLDGIEFVVKIAITLMIDMDGKKVERSNWDHLGVVDRFE